MMATKFKIVKVLEKYSSKEFAEFISENGFPECKEFIIQTNMIYSTFLDTPEFKFRSAKSINFSNFNKFCKFHKKLKISPEECILNNPTFKNNIRIKVEEDKYQDEQKNTCLATKPIVFVTPSIPTKPIGLIKPGIAQKPNIINNRAPAGHLRSSSLDTTDSTNAQFLTVSSQVKISEEPRVQFSNIAMTKNLPHPPKFVNISSVPNLPDYFELNSKYSSRSKSAEDIDFDGDDEEEEEEEEEVYNTPPEDLVDKDAEVEDDIYCEAVDPEDQHSSVHSAPVHTSVPPKVDRYRKPELINHIPQADRPYNSISTRNLQIARNPADNNDDGDVHVYEQLPLSPKENHARENNYSMDPTYLSERNVQTFPTDVEHYLSPRQAILSVQLAVDHRPLPPTPEQDYTLEHLKNETYFRDIDRKSAEKILQTEPIGTFLVRPSTKFFCCLSIKAVSKIFNIGTVKLDGNKFHLFVGEPEDLVKFHSITDLINFYMENGISIPDGDKIMQVKIFNAMKTLRLNNFPF